MSFCSWVAIVLYFGNKTICWVQLSNIGQEMGATEHKKTQRQNRKKDGTGRLKTSRINSPDIQCRITFIELLGIQEVSVFWDNISFPCSQSCPQLMFFFWTSMLFSVQRAPYGWEKRSRQEHHRKSVYASSFLTCTDLAFLSPHSSFSVC